jgi:hypothetical protein
MPGPGSFPIETTCSHHILSFAVVCRDEVNRNEVCRDDALSGSSHACGPQANALLAESGKIPGTEFGNAFTTHRSAGNFKKNPWSDWF